MLLFENNNRISQPFPSSDIPCIGLVDLSTAMEPPWLTLVDDPLHIGSGNELGVFEIEMEFLV